MPCCYHDDHYGGVLVGENELNTLTRLACERCELLQRQGQPIPVWARDWWEEHQRRDAERKKREADKQQRDNLKASAASKLTSAEKEALGIK